MTKERDQLVRKIAALKSEFASAKDFTGFLDNSGKIVDDTPELLRNLKSEIADLESELKAMDDDATRA